MPENEEPRKTAPGPPDTPEERRKKDWEKEVRDMFKKVAPDDSKLDSEMKNFLYKQGTVPQVAANKLAIQARKDINKPEDLEESIVQYKKGDRVRVDMSKLKGKPAPYLKLVKKAITDGKTTVISQTGNSVDVAKDTFDAILGTVTIPIEAIKESKKMNIEDLKVKRLLKKLDEKIANEMIKGLNKIDEGMLRGAMTINGKKFKDVIAFTGGNTVKQANDFIKRNSEWGVLAQNPTWADNPKIVYLAKNNDLGESMNEDVMNVGLGGDGGALVVIAGEEAAALASLFGVPEGLKLTPIGNGGYCMFNGGTLSFFATQGKVAGGAEQPDMGGIMESTIIFPEDNKKSLEALSKAISHVIDFLDDNGVGALNSAKVAIAIRNGVNTSKTADSNYLQSLVHNIKSAK